MNYNNLFRNDITYLITLGESHFIPCIHCINSFIALGKDPKQIMVVGNLKDNESLNTIKELGINYIDENDIDYRKRIPEISFKVNKLREAGWFKQQFIRLAADLFITTPYVLILDAEVFPFTNWDESRFFENIDKEIYPRYLYWIPEKRKPDWDYKMYIGSAMFLKDLPEFSLGGGGNIRIRKF